MTVVAFALCRFTPADIVEFNAIAEQKLQRGLWSATQRESGNGFDRISISFPGVERPVFSFERDKKGGYNLWYHDRSGAHSIGTGYDAVECLSVWRPRARPAATAAAAPRTGTAASA